MGKQVLVTGGAGFIGSNLIRMLLATPGVDRVVAFDDLSTGYRANLDGVDAELMVASLLDRPALEKAVVNADAVVHLAALGSVPRSVADPIATHEANTNGTLNVLEAVRANGAHLVVASSSSVYGSNPQLPKVETMATRPMSPYAATKLATETYSLAWANSYGLPVLAFRFFNVYGPRQAAGHAYAAVIPTFLDAAFRGEPLWINGDGEYSRDFTNVGTVCSVIVDALKRTVVSDVPVNLALGTRTTINALAGLIGEVTGRDLDIRHRQPRAGDVPHSMADPALLRNLFPEVEPVTLREGLEQTAKWMPTGKHD